MLARMLVLLLVAVPGPVTGQDRQLVERELRVINDVLAGNPSTSRARAGAPPFEYFHHVGVGDGHDVMWVSCESGVCASNPREEARLADIVELEILYVRGGFGEISYWSVQFRCSTDPFVGSNCTRPSDSPMLSARFADPNRDDLRLLVGSFSRLWSEIAPGRPCTFWPQFAGASVPCSAVGG